MSPWPCHLCGQPSIKHLGTSGFCLAHLVELLRTFSPSSFSDVGMMLPSGPERPEWGDGEYDCSCARCGAQHIAAPLECCPWCMDAAVVRDRHQVEIVLTPPAVERGDASYEAVMKGWAQRMANAVAAGLVTQAEASRVWRRECARAAA